MSALAVTGDTSGHLREDAQQVVSGKLSSTGVSGTEHWQIDRSVGLYGHLQINEDGHWRYTLDNTSSKVQGLCAGEQVREHFVAAVTDSAGRTRFIPLTIAIDGTADQAIIRGSDAGQVTEDRNLLVSGTLTVSDVDADQAHFHSTVLSGRLGILTLDTAGHWFYQLDNGNVAVQALGAGKTATDVLTVSSMDGTTHQITITVHGSNDRALISGTHSATVTEDNLLGAQGRLSVSDVDQGEAGFVPQTLTGGYGQLQLDAQGHWSYQLDNANPSVQALGEGESATDTLTVTSLDGTPQQITIVIRGGNDVAQITGSLTGSVAEDSALLAKGTLVVTDADQHQAHFNPEVVSGQYGNFSLDANGHWLYVLDNTSLAVQGLKSGEQVTDVITVTSVDGTACQLHISVAGTNDIPVLSAQAQAVTEDGVLLTGQLQAHDVDHQDMLAFSASTTPAGFILNVDGSYSFDPSHVAYQHLAAGQVQTLTIPITVTDSVGASSTQNLMISLTGTNDGSTISGVDTGSTAEGNTQLVTGQLTIADVDDGQAHFMAQVGVAGTYGTFTLNEQGQWTYQLDNSKPALQALKTGDSVTDRFTVSGADGTMHQVSMTVTGKDDGALIAGTDSATVTEDQSVHSGQLQASGQLSITDPDAGEAHFTAQTSVAGTYGSFSIDTTGYWTYSADNSQTAIQQLKAGDSLTDTVTVTSADGTSHTVTVTLQGTNDTPVLQAQTQAVTEDGTQLQGRMVATDVDAHDTQAFSMANAVDGFTLNADGSYSFAPSHASYQHLSAGQTQDVVIPVTVTDSAGTISTKNLTITVTGINDGASIAGVSSGNTAEDNPQAVTGKLSIADADDGQAHFLAQSGTAGHYGSFTLAEDGHWSYQLDNSKAAVQALKTGDSVTDSFTVTSADGTPHQVTVTVNGKDDGAVIGGSDSGNVTEDSNATAGQIATAGQLTVTDPDAGQDHFNAQVTKGLYGTFTIDAAGHWGYSADNSQAAIQGLKAGATLTDSMTVSSADGTSHTLSVTIQGSNDAPTLSAQAQSVTEDGARLTGQMVASDLDTGDTQAFSTQNPPAGFTLNADGSYSFDPADAAYQHLAAGQTQTLTIPITVTDSAGATSTQNLSITIIGSNDSAIIGGRVANNITEDSVVSAGGMLRAGGQLTVVDPDAGEAVFVVQTGVSGAGHYGSFSIDASGHYSYTADNTQATIQQLKAGETLTDRFTVATADGTQQVVTITINGAEDKPVLQAQTHAITEDGARLTGKMLATDVDAGDTQRFSVAHPVAGFALNPDGSFSFNPATASYQHLASGQTQDVVIPITVIDSAGGTSTQNLTITVTGVNDRATISGVNTGSTAEDNTQAVTGQLTVADVDDGQAHFVAQSGSAGTYGTFSLNEQGQWSYSLDNSKASVQALKTGDSVTDSFTVTSADGTTHQVSVTVTGKDDGAVIGGADSGTVTEDQSITAGKIATTGQLFVTDPDAGEDHFTAQANAAGSNGYGSFSIDTAGHWIYTADNTQTAIQQLKAGETLTDSVTVTSVDGTQHTISVTIAGANDGAIIAGTDRGSVTEDTAVASGTITTSGILTITDADAGEAHFVAQSAIAGTYGSLAIDEQGHWTYNADNSQKAIQDLNTGDHLTDTLTVRAADGTTQTITITLEGKNDKVLAGSLSGSAVEDTTPIITGDLHNIQSGTALHLGDQVLHGQFGTLDLRDGGHWIYTLDNANPLVQGLKAGDTRTETITVHPPQGEPQDITITITGTHDQPVISVPTAAAHGIDAVSVINDINGATDFGSIAETATGVNTGLKVVAMYLPGSTVNQLAGIPADQLATTQTAYALNGGLGFQYLSSSGWLATHMPTLAATFNTHGARNNWDGGIVVFQDGSVGRMINVHGGNPGENDYIYFKLIPGVNANHGLTTLHGSGTAGATLEVFDGQTSLGHVTVAADGHWTLTATQALADGDHQLHTLTNGVASDPQTVHVSGGAVTIADQAASLGAVTEDSASHSDVSGQLTVSDVDANDHPAFTAQHDSQGTYGKFSIDAQGQWHYVLDNSLAATQALAAGQVTTESFHVTVTTDSGETVTRDVTFRVTGSNDAPVVTAATSVSAATLDPVTEDTAKSYTEADLLKLVGASDIEGDHLSITGITVDAQYGSFTKLQSGDWQFTPAPNAHHDDIPVSITVSDGHQTTTAHAQLDITPVTDAPTPGLAVVAEQHVIEFGQAGTGAILNSGTLQTHGAMSAMAIEFSVIGGQQVAVAGHNGPTLVSYATPSNSDEFYIWNPANLTVKVNGQEYATGVNMGSDTASHRFTFLWDGAAGTLDVLRDGQVVKHLDGVGQGYQIPGDGKLAFGNDQDSFGGGFSPSDAWHGQMFSAALATGHVTPAQVAQAPLRDVLHGSPSLVIDIQASGSGLVDTTGHHTVTSVGVITTPSTMVDTQIASPNPGALLHLTPSFGTPADADDHLTQALIKGFAAGTVLDDGHGHAHTVTGPDDKVDIHDWNTASLTAQLPAGSHDNLRLEMQVTTTGPDGATAVACTDIPIVIDHAQAVPSVTIFDPGVVAPGVIDVQILLNGNASAQFSGDVTGAVTENTVVSTHGQLTVTDSDAGQSFFKTQTHDGSYGSLSINPKGQWTYTLDNSKVEHLAAGQTLLETVRVTSADGTPQDITITIHGSNDAPVVNAQTQSVTEDGALLRGLLVATDIDTGDTQSYSTTQAVDGFTLNTDGSYQFDPSHASYQHLAAGQTQDVLIPITVTDSAGATSTQNLTITVTGSSDTAVIGGRITNFVTEDSVVSTAAMLRAGGQVTVVDPDAGEAVFVAQTSVTGAGHYGSFSIDASGHYSYTADNTQRAIQQLKAGETLTDRFTVATADGTQQVVTITINGAEDKPVLQAQTHAVTEDGARLTGKMLATDVDAGDTQRFSVAHPVAGFALNPDGSFSFNPATASYQHLASGQTQDVVIPITVIDSTGGTSTQNLTITVTGVNDRAVISGVSNGRITEDQGFSATHTLSCGGKLDVTDVDTGEAAFAVQHGAGANGYGNFVLDPSGNWTYSADNTQSAIQQLKAGETLTDTFTASSTDGTTHTVTVTIQGTNDAPVLAAQTQAFTEDGTLLQGRMVATDVDAHDTQTFSIAQPVDGFTLNTDGSYSFDPRHASYQHLAAGQTQDVVIPVTVTDSAGATATQNLTIRLIGTNDAPHISGADVGRVVEDQTLSVNGQLQISDADDGQAHFVAQTATAGSYGSLTLSEDGHWQYQLDNSKPEVQALKSTETATDTFTVHSADGSSHSITITIQGQRDNVVIGGVDVGVVKEDVSAVTGGHLVATGESAEFVPLQQRTTLGDFSMDADGAWTYTLDNSRIGTQALKAGETATETVTITHTDGSTHSITLSVMGTNDAPVLSAQTQAVTEDGTQLTGHLVATDADHGDTQTFSHANTVDGFTLNADGSYSFDPSHASYQHLAAGQTQDLVIPITVTDSTGLSSTQNLTITLTGSNDGATIAGTDSGAVTEDSHITSGKISTSGTLTVIDPDAGQDHFNALISNGHYGVFTLDAAGQWTYSADNSKPEIQHLKAGDTLTDSFTVTSADGTAHTVTVIVAGTNDAPVLAAQTQAVTEDGAQLQGHMVATDVDASDTQVFSTAQVIDGFTLNADGSYSFDPANAAYQHLATGQTQNLVIPITVTDSAGATSTQNLTITITGANDGAVISGVATGTVTEDLTLSVSGQLAITDADDGQAHFVAQTATAGSYGSLTLSEDGHWQYQLDNSKPEVQALKSTETATDTFTVHSADGSSHSITVTIQGQRDSVVIGGVDVGVVKEDVSAVTGGHLVATGESAEFVPVSSLRTTLGEFSMDADGAWSYTLDNSATTAQALKDGETTTDNVSITHTDGTTHTITITVMGTNDAPVLAAQTQAVTEDGSLLSGHMVATDVDAGDTQSFSIASAVDGFTLNADGSYQFDPTHASYQHLAAGQTQDVVIPVTVTDSAGATSTQNLTITVTGTNDTAVIGGRIANFVTEDGVVSTAGMLRAGGQLTVVDPDAGEAVFVAQTGVSGAGHYGSFSIDASGRYSYTADNTQNAIQQLKAGETLTDRFTVATADGTQQVVTITIKGAEDKPVLQAQSQSVTEDGSLLRGQMVATDVDAGDTQHFSVAHPVAGFVLNPDGSYTFNPAHAAYQHLAAGQTQDVVIPITVIDSGGGTSTENLTITVAGTNDAPDIRSTRASARMVYVDAPSISITGQLHVRDTDDGDTQTWSVSGGGQGHFGHLDFDAQTGRWTYQLDKSDADTQALKAGEQAQEAFQITVTDGSGASSSTIVRVMVVGTNDAPILTAQSQTVTEDGAQLNGHMVATDVDAGDTQSFSIANAVDGFTLNADGSYSFDPSNAAYQHLIAGQTQDLVIPVTVTDSAGASHTQNLTFTITGANDGAVIGGAFTGAVTEDQSVQSGQLQATGQLSITDADSGEGRFIPQTDVLGSYGLGRFSLDAQGHWSYSADNSQKAIQQLAVGATLNDSFTVQAADGAQHTVTVTLTGTNDAPQFHLQVAPDYHPEVESGDVLPLVINNIGSSRIAQYLDIQQILQGQAPIGAYANTCVTVSLGGLALVGPDGQAAQVFAPGQEFKLQTLVDWQQQGPGHEFRVFGPKGTVGLDISFHDAGDPNHITGPQGQASLYVNQVSIWPPFHAWQASASTGTASDSGLLTATEGGPALSGQFHASDIDVGDTLAFSLGHPVDGFTLNADGSYSFDPSNAAYQHLAAGQSETLSIPITVTDSAGASTTQTLTILLRGANDAATFGGVETGATQEDRPDALSGQLTVADADDGEAHFIAQSGTAGSYGQFSLDENGQWHYQIDNSKPEVQALRDGQNVTDSFTVRSADGTAHTVNISIAGKNDAAVITGEDHQTLTEDQNVSGGQLIAHGQLHASTPDAGGDQFTPLQDLAGKFGHLSLGADGSWVYKADNNSPAVQALHGGQSATESFTVHSVDGTAHTLSLSIQGADEPRHDIWSSIVSTIKSNWAPYNLIGHAIDARDVGALGSMRLAFTSGNPSVVDANGHVLASGSSLGAFGHDISIGQVLDLLKSHPGAQLVLDGNVGGSSGFYLHDSGNVMELHFRGLSHYNTANNPMGQVPIDGLPTPLSAAATVPDVSDSLTISVTDISVDHAGQLQTSGQLSISDADTGENHFNAQRDVAGTYGSFSIDASGHWVYSVDNGQAAVQNLQAGAQLTDSFMVMSADGTSHVVSVAVYGKNDAPVLFAQAQAVSEDGALLNGQMHASDADTGDTQTFSIDQPVAGFALKADGSYSFDPSNAAYQHLAEGQIETLTIPITVTDHMGASSVRDLTITLTGKNDAAVITGVDQRTVTEDQDVDGFGNLHVTGQLQVDDPDGNAGPLQFQQQNTVQASYGHFTLNADGYWLYEADNKNPAIQQLKTGESLTDTLTAHSADGTAHTITVTIQGQDDAAAFVPQAQAAQVSSSDVYTIIGVQLMSSEHREFQFMAEVLLGNTDPRSYVSAEMSFTNTSVALRAPDGSLASVYHAAGGMTTVPLMDLRNWHNKGQGYDVVLVDATGMPVNVFPHDPGDPDKMSGFNQYVTGFSGPFNAAVVLYPDMQAASSGGAVQGSAVVPAMAPVLYDAAHVLEDNGQQISGFIEVQDADQGQSSMQPMTVHHAAHGTFSIDVNGDWVYQLDSSRPDVQALKDGETLLETITVHSADGTPHTVNITIHGQSDGAVISGADTGRVIEDQQVTAAGRIETHGQLTVSDVDAGEAVFVAQNAVATKFGHFSIDASGAWRYEVDNNKAEVQALKPGGTPGETGHVFHALAEALSQSTQPGFHAVGEALSRGTTDGVEGALDLSIQGAAIVLSGPAGTTPVVYAMDAQGRSTIGVDELLSWMHQGMGYEVHLQGAQTDVQAFVHDRGDAARLHGLPLSGVAELNDPASAAQHLALQWHTAPVPGELSEVVSVASADGTTHQITLNIQGTAEDAVITGVDTGSVTEDAHVTGAGLIEAHGQLAIQDPDKGQAAFAPLHELAGQYGHLSLEASGLWTYTADNNSAALNGLSKNQSAVETFVVKSVDGTAHTINVTVNGADEKPDLWPEISRTLMAQGGWDTRGYQVIAQRMAAGDSAGLRDVVMNVFDGKPTVVDAAGHVLHTFDQGTKFFGYRVPMDELCQQLKAHPGAMLVMQGSVGGSAGYFFHNAGDEGMLRFEGAYMNQPANHLLGSVPINGLPQANAGGAAHGNAAAQLGGADSGSVLADGDAQLQTQGHMTVLDADGGQAHFTVQHGVHGHYGQFSIDAQGSWHYQADGHQGVLQQLAAGQALSDSFSVTSADGSSHTVTVQLFGSRVATAAVISGVDSGSVVEDAAQAVVGGQLSIVDPDPGEAHFIAQADVPAQHGHFSLQDNGAWTYTLDNKSATVQALKAGESFTEHLTVSSVDGSTHVLTVTVQGSNDTPMLQAQSQSVTEDGSLLRGQMAAQDVDHGDALHFSTPNAVGGFTLNADGSYSFDPSHHDYQSLTAGQVRDIDIPITVTDSAGATATQLLSIHITGRNDSTFIYGVDSGQVQAGVHPQTSGDLHASDDDAGQGGFQAGTVKGSFGSLSIDAQGHWTYQVDGHDSFVQHLLPNSHITEQLTVHSVDGTAHDIDVEVGGAPAGMQLPPVIQLPASAGGHDVFAGILAAVHAAGYQYQGLADELDKGSLASVGNLDLSITGVHVQVVDKFGQVVQSISPTAENAATLHVSELLLWHAQGHSIVATSDSGLDSTHMWLHNSGDLHNIQVSLPDGTGFNGWVEEYTFGELSLTAQPPAPSPAPPAADDFGPQYDDPTPSVDNLQGGTHAAVVVDLNHPVSSADNTHHEAAAPAQSDALHDPGLDVHSAGTTGGAADSYSPVADYLQFAGSAMPSAAMGEHSGMSNPAVHEYLAAAGIDSLTPTADDMHMPPTAVLMDLQHAGVSGEHTAANEQSVDPVVDDLAAIENPLADDPNQHHGGI
ncbi:VCBS domain-containing protein [Pseudomonas sp. SL4(2022)]|uniref:VCBS domain-containing protein n=1 Tax=Pseudomonas sp. SL4(2022) TaxID=2994661 RepID=UPI002271B2AF|nr:VCBS domain-containing protein [Pseudomonas sp. SL4(2022)]WAC44493.1 VCBS domain-containing protein [Pseudomonas sp. SL4(2022)]